MALRSLNQEDATAVHELHAQVRAALPDPALFQLWGGAEAFIAAHLPGPAARGESLGVWEGKRLIAYGSLTRPRAADADNYAACLGWPAARADCVGLLSAAMVAPDRRGLGLQGRLIDARIARAAALGIDELLCRASPANAVSRGALMRRGFALAWLGEQAGGLLRHVFWRPRDGLPTASALRWVAETDLDAQRAALTQGLMGLCLSEQGIGFG